MAKLNALQAVLDRAKAGGSDTPAAAPTISSPAAKPASSGRQGTKLIG